MKGYDESNDLANTVMQFKASLAKFVKVKQQINIKIGDEKSLDDVIR